jgi:hypothetical protein
VRSVGRILAGKIRRNDLTSKGVDGDMQFALVPVPWRFSERAHMDREARAVDPNVDWLVASWRTDGKLPELLSSWLRLKAGIGNSKALDTLALHFEARAVQLRARSKQPRRLQ